MGMALNSPRLRSSRTSSRPRSAWLSPAAMERSTRPLSGSIRRSGTCPIGLIPAGTANCLAASFGLNLKDAEACEIAFRGNNRRPLDILTYRVPEEDRTRLILQSSSLGLPSNVGVSYERLRQSWFWRLLFRLLGNASYNLLAFFEIRYHQRRREWRNEPVLSMKIVFPPEENKPDFEGDVLAFFLHNEPTIGGNLVPCPKARTG